MAGKTHQTRGPAENQCFCQLKEQEEIVEAFRTKVNYRFSLFLD